MIAPLKTELFHSLRAAHIVGQGDNSVRLAVGDAVVEVTALAPDVFRVGMFLSGRSISYSSEATDGAQWQPLHTNLEENDVQVRLVTDAAQAVIHLDPLRIHFQDAQGRIFAADADPGMGYWDMKPPFPLQEIGPPVRVYKQHPETEHYFGCGERTAGLDKTDSHQLFYNIDPPSGHNPAQSNLYVSIPFVLALDGGQAWGLFLDNPARSEFDLAQEQPDRSWFGAENGDLIYYVFAGPAPPQVVARYTQLTGHIPMPPLWSLGHQQSRYSYMNEAELREVARQFREHGIPCDVLYLDIHYMDGYRIFTWDRERFPDPQRLLADLREEGFRVVTIVDPGIKVDERYPVYTEGREDHVYCLTFAGREYHNVVWPGTCAFPDFTSQRTRVWWREQLPSLLDAGVAGIWCDMDEPALFVPLVSTMPDDVVHPGDSDPHFHAQVHNLYGSLMARATYEGLAALQPDKRPFVITRSGFAGLQRYALHWTGDNNSWWEHLRMAMPQLQNLGLSGVAWVGVDIGGFTGDTTGELLARWTEFGVFQPYCRNHSGLGTRRQEPWAFGEPYESVIRTMLLLRQRLLPFLYSLFEESHRTGAPILRPLLFHYPDDPTTYHRDDEFLVGDSLLVAPVVTPGTEYRHVYLPQGVWFHLWSGERINGPAHILAHAPLGQPPVYQRANAPLPLWPAMQYLGERPADPLTWRIVPAEGEGEFSLYEDAGEGYEFLRGMFRRQRVTCRTEGGQIIVTLDAAQGSYRPERSRIQLELPGITPDTVQVNGERTEWEALDGAAVITLHAGDGALEIVITL